jgi:putative membrane protein
MRLHPLSAVLRGLQRGLLAASFVFFVFSIGSGALGDVVGLPFGLVFVLFPLAFLAGLGYQIAYYYRFEYVLTPDTFDITSGVFGRQEREIPYRRVQNVDITESLFHRLVGVAVVNVETAGGSETEGQLNFVGADEARRIQREIRERRAAARGETREQAAEADADAETEAETEAEAAVGDESGPAAAAPVGEASESAATDADAYEPSLIFALSSAELTVLALASFRAASILVFVVGLPIVQDVLVDIVTGLVGVQLDPGAIRQTPDLAFLAALVGLVLAIVGTWVVSAGLTFIEYYNFTLGRLGDDLVYERGLLQRYSGSIPTDKVQTLTIEENALMRKLGYAGLTVETAGYSPGQSNSGGAQSAIPLAARERTLGLARDLEPFGDLSFTRPPKRARRRYVVRYGLVVLAATGVLWGISQVVTDFTLWYSPLVLLAAVPVAAHYKWKHRGYHVGDEQFVVRDGFWRRQTRVVPYYRLQTVIQTRSVFQRRLDLAHLTADTATSSLLGRRDATAYDIATEDAARIYEIQRDRLQTSVRERAADAG